MALTMVSEENAFLSKCAKFAESAKWKFS